MPCSDAGGPGVPPLRTSRPPPTHNALPLGLPTLLPGPKASNLRRRPVLQADLGGAVFGAKYVFFSDAANQLHCRASASAKLYDACMARLRCGFAISCASFHSRRVLLDVPNYVAPSGGRPAECPHRCYPIQRNRYGAPRSRGLAPRRLPTLTPDHSPLRTAARSTTGPDLSDLQYVSDNIDDDLICVICMGPWVEPLQTPCEHVFCKA